MCGICGFVERAPRSGPDALDARVRGMAATLRHRGPDAGGSFCDAGRGVALGHRRLSILDLSDAGAQPMRSSCGRYVLSYNGEIYAHAALRGELEGRGRVFRGHSDTEVLVEAIAVHGIERTLERIDGMFAFAVWDRETATLTLVRDRMGKKPLYYGEHAGVFLFGSELKALRAHPAFEPEVDRDALAFFVRHSYVPAPHSIYRGIRKLEAGGMVSLSPEGLGPVRLWWSPRESAERGARAPFADGVAAGEDALHALLQDAVARRLVSDVPLGGLLSGGIDSSLVVALMQSASERPVRTFSIGFREAGYDEAPHARHVARHLGTDHTELVATPRDALDAIPLLPRLYDEPFADTSQLPTYLVSRLAREHVTVALSGDGGDELFGGYERYFRVLDRWRWLAPVPRGMRTALAAGLAALAPARLEKVADTLRAESVRDLFLRMNARCPDVAPYVPGARLARSVLDSPEAWAKLDEPLAWMMYVDLVGSLRESILVKVDRASMGVGLEVRSPLLDYRVVEWSAQAPLDWKLRAGERKWILRRLLERHVPRALFERPKMGFGVPIGDWLRGPLRDWAESLLAPERLRNEGHLGVDAVRAAWDQHSRGVRDRRFLLWNLLMFQAWLEESRASLGAGPPEAW